MNNMNFGNFNFDSLLKSVSNIKNMKSSTSGSTWPSISNSSTLRTTNSQVRAAARDVRGEADTDVTKKMKEFNDLKNSITPILNTYENNRVNSINLFDSLQNYIDENKKLEKQVADTSSDIQTNDRKTFYQNESTDSLDSYYWILLSVYIVTVIGFAVCWYMLPTAMSNLKLMFLFICLILYPLFSTRILQYIMYLYNLLLDFLPKNANTL